MDKKGNEQFFHRLQRIKRNIQGTYLYKMISKFLSVACTIILIVLLIVGAFMFYFNIKANSYQKKGLEYTAPFGLYTIISGSMEPNVSVYDVVIAVDEDISKIKVGDVITFISDWEINYGLTVTHRVVAINKNANGEYALTTKGDNNGSADGSVVTQHNLVGRVVGRIPALGRLQFFLATKMGWFMIVFIPALGIIIFDLIKIFRLYVLKDKVKNVKSTKDLPNDGGGKLKVDDILDNRDKEDSAPIKENEPVSLSSARPKISDVILEPVNDDDYHENKVKNVELEPIDTDDMEDKNIDTVELPKVGEDGKVKENTLEIPALEKKSNTLIKNDENKVSLEDIITHEDFDDDFSDSLTDSLPMLKNDEKKANEDNEKRRMLKRRQ